MPVNGKKPKKVVMKLCWGSPLLQNGVAGEAAALRPNQNWLSEGGSMTLTVDKNELHDLSHAANTSIIKLIRKKMHMTKLKRQTLTPNFHKHRKARCKILKPVISLSVGSKSVINKVMTISSSGEKNNNDVGHNLQIEFGLFGVRVSPVSFYKASTKSLEIRGYLKN